eukprot:3746186-Rhodomonas_salina.1
MPEQGRMVPEQDSVGSEPDSLMSEPVSFASEPNTLGSELDSWGSERDRVRSELVGRDGTRTPLRQRLAPPVSVLGHRTCAGRPDTAERVRRTLFCQCEVVIPHRKVARKKDRAV